MKCEDIEVELVCLMAAVGVRLVVLLSCRPWHVVGLCLGFVSFRQKCQLEIMKSESEKPGEGGRVSQGRLSR